MSMKHTYILFLLCFSSVCCFAQISEEATELYTNAYCACGYTFQFMPEGRFYIKMEYDDRSGWYGRGKYEEKGKKLCLQFDSASRPISVEYADYQDGGPSIQVNYRPIAGEVMPLQYGASIQLFDSLKNPFKFASSDSNGVFYVSQLGLRNVKRARWVSVGFFALHSGYIPLDKRKVIITLPEDYLDLAYKKKPISPNTEWVIEYKKTGKYYQFKLLHDSAEMTEIHWEENARWGKAGNL